MKFRFSGFILGAILVATVLPTPILAVNFSAETVSVPSPVSLKAGATTEMEIRIKNTGATTWLNSGDNAIKLGTIEPQDHAGKFYHGSWLSENRVATMQESAVATGEVAIFRFSVTAAGEGQVTEKLGLVSEMVTWFDAISIPVTLQVQPAVWRATVVQQSITTAELKSGETADVVVQIRNDGDITWQTTGASAVKIGTASPFDRKSNFATSTWLSPNRVAVASNTVTPNATGSFTVTLQAPAQTGTYTEKFAVVAEGITWMPVEIVVTIKVVPAVYAAQYVGQSASAISLGAGESTAAWVEIRNTGNTTWHATGEAATKLGTARALDRQSVFYDASWLSQNRVAAISPTEVKPNEIARFNFTFKASDRVGEQFREYFRPVVEGVTWMTDLGIYFDVSIDEEIKLANPIRVGLTSVTGSVTVQGSNFVVRRGTDKGLVGAFQNQTITIVPLSFGYSVNGQNVSDWIRVIPLNNSILTVNSEGIGAYNAFRGMIVVRRSPVTNNIWVVNELELDDYTKGIAEVPNSFPVEAQKAQMVAARTFAVKKRSDSTSRDIFDLYDDTRSQVYYGYNYEKDRPNLVAASESTKGMVIKHGGQPISAYYFSDSGGHTSNVEWVWGGNPIAYLKGVPDPWAKTDNWSYTLTQEYLKGRFDNTLGIAASGSEIIDKVEITESYPSNWAKTVVFTLRSGRTIPVDGRTFDYLTSNNEIRSLNISKIETVGYVDAPSFAFTGKGWGHNIGMPQWGARNMADAGKNYQEILTYYYTGVTVEPA